MTRTIVHAGFHKTGTTTLQQGLAANRVWLEQQGWIYPVEHCGDMPAQHELACKLCSARVSPGPNDLFLPEREAFSSGWGARGGAPIEGAPFPPSAHAARVISSEIFSTFDQNETLRLAAAIGPVERFVLYVRNGIGYLHSCWAAKVRWGHKDGFDSFLRASVDFEPATPILGPISYVDMIVGLFGADRISVRNFDVALQHPRKLFGDFLEVELGLPEGLDFPTGLVANASPSKVITEVQRALNVLGGRSKPGEAPSSHAALRQSLASPNGSRLVDLFSKSLQPITKPICIADITRSTFAEDGSFRRCVDRSSRMTGWKFPPEERSSFCDTDELLDALGQLPEFVEISKGNSC